MPVPSTEFAVRGDHITLDALLKACGVVMSGGEAKVRIAAGEVEVDGEVETRRGRKLRPGQTARCGDWSVRLTAG
jgi:ribosome-associated protein